MLLLILIWQCATECSFIASFVVGITRIPTRSTHQVLGLEF